jgi:hypothetical protein
MCEEKVYEEAEACPHCGYGEIERLVSDTEIDSLTYLAHNQGKMVIVGYSTIGFLIAYVVFGHIVWASLAVTYLAVAVVLTMSRWIRLGR